MDIISLGKASNALRAIQKLDNQIVAPQAESRFVTVEDRLNWIEDQANKIKSIDSYEVDLSKGTFTNAELVDGKIQLRTTEIIDTGTKENIIPKMTSNTLPSGVASTSGNYNNNYAAWKAFNGLIGGLDVWWSGQPLNGEQWIKYEFPVAKKIVKYSIQHGGTGFESYNPKSWKLQSLDGSGQWVTLDERTGINQWALSEVKSFTFENSNSYKTYRLLITQAGSATADNNMQSTGAVVIGEWQMSESGMTTMYVPSGSYESPVIDLGDAYNETSSLDIAKQTFAGMLSSDITTGGTGAISGGDFAADRHASYAFNDTNATWWSSLQTKTAVANTAWIGYAFEYPRHIRQFSIHQYSVLGNQVGSVKLQRSDDMVTWMDVQDFTLTRRDNVAKETFAVNPSGASKYWRLLATTGVATTAEYTWPVYEVEFMEMQGVTNAVIEYATSADGVTFSEYATLTETLPQGRFMKFKVNLSAMPEPDTITTVQFNQSEDNTVTLNEYTLANGDLFLKKNYVYESEDVSVASDSKITKTRIPRSVFESITKLEVK